MPYKADIDSDINNYLNEYPSNTRETNAKLLLGLFDKHFKLDENDHVIKYEDLFKILDYAKYLYPRTKMPMSISGQTLDEQESLRVFILESILVYLNNRQLLRKTVKVEYR